AMGKAVDSYNAAVASLEPRVFSTARKFQTLGAVGKKEIQELQPIDQKPRALTAIDATDAIDAPTQ
ncbi:MAG: DNA recombination protein RmuC, partial [candidate division NC10 bacterium]|nr:DNA recombination protein RmuC [candidate division NC10 bacterium]